ncbi:unnamed protein product, partial [Hapterophycus canaliculatus]
PSTGATAAVFLCALALTLDPVSSFAGPAAAAAAAAASRSSSFAARRQRYRPAESSISSGRRRGIPASAAAPPSSPTPPSKKRPNKKKSGVGTVKFSGGRVTRPVQPATNDSKEEEDVRKSARWGVKPPAPAKILGVVDVGALKNPFNGVGSSLRKASDRSRGVTAAKDAVYGVADAAGSVAEQLQGAAGKGRETQRYPLLVAVQAAAVGGKSEGGGGVKRALRLLGGGAVAVKDAFWGSLDVLGAAGEAATKAPEAAKGFVEEGKAVIEAGAKVNVEAAAKVPGQAVEAVSGAVEAVSDAVGSAGKAAVSVKEGAYGAVDAVTRLAAMPAEMAEKQRREQEERLEVQMKSAAERKVIGAKIGAGVEGAKAAVWGTVDGVETLVETVASTPAAVGDGLGKAKEAVTSAGELLESIPRAVQDIPLEAQRTLDGVRASVASTQATAEGLVSGIKGGVEGVSSLVQKASTVASGKEKKEREEKQKRQAVAAREKKRKNALVTFRGEPYT